jgi:hypothetical protein
MTSHVKSSAHQWFGFPLHKEILTDLIIGYFYSNSGRLSYIALASTCLYSSQCFSLLWEHPVYFLRAEGRHKTLDTRQAMPSVCDGPGLDPLSYFALTVPSRQLLIWLGKRHVVRAFSVLVIGFIQASAKQVSGRQPLALLCDISQKLLLTPSDFLSTTSSLATL